MIKMTTASLNGRELHGIIHRCGKRDNFNNRASAIILTIAYFTYGKFLANSVFKLDDKNPVPSVEMEDGVDYLPAKKGMLLGQHFSAIAAAGPINGPILAAVIYGWAPALLWVILGCIFIGGIHDMGSLVASVRHNSRYGQPGCFRAP